ncbi:MAG: replication initiator [Kineosporiaceae bacterium]
MSRAPGTVGVRLPTDADMRAYAIGAGVCVRPLVRKVTDTTTGHTQTVAIRCGSTREYVCPPCAARARALRAQQCAEGWHLTDDPLTATEEDGTGEDEDHADELADEVGEDADEEDGRRVRSTRRRDDAADLPRVPTEIRTVGRTFHAPDGTVYRPSMFVTLTLPSYGRVTPGTGAPVHPGTYDYETAARDAVALSALMDRWVQNLRRCAGYKVQYFAVIEAQRRLAGHVHIAIRGAIPRALIKQVTRATYASLWWPSTRTVVYGDGDAVPVWDSTAANGAGAYLDPTTRTPLPTWAHALDTLGARPDASPWHVTRFGSQVDIKGLIAPSPDTDRAVRYLVKYLTKSIAHTYAPVDETTGRPLEVDPTRTAHVDRLAAELRYTPCGPRCANWLRYGIQPKDPGPGLIPGMCPGRAHDRENTGLGGRRVLVSRHWSGKTLTEHAADRATVVRETLAAAGIQGGPDIDRLAADQTSDDGTPRYRWEPVEPGEVDYRAAVLHLAHERHHWRQQYTAAKAIRDGPSGPCGQPFSNRSDGGSAAA